MNTLGITILGATGSIGVNTLEVISLHENRFKVVALTAHRDVEKLYQQCLRWQPQYAVMSDTDAAEQLARHLRSANQSYTQVLNGADALEKVASLTQVDYVMAAIVGAAGLLPTLAAARSGKRILLANKEALVMAGQLFMDAIKIHGAHLLPIDSEHNALFQCLPLDYSSNPTSAGIERLLLTGSGGPFRETCLTELFEVTPEQACAHPNWNMGRKISVDSATMMNKGLEIIEACWLFNVEPERVQVVVHPQSIIHSMVEYTDGSVLAQLGNPDMRTPIAHALAWPERIASGVKPLDFFQIGRLDFYPPDFQRFPCLRLACEALSAQGTAPAILNAANEVAVSAFLEKQIRFTDIPTVIENALEQVKVTPANSLQNILESDATARETTQEMIHSL